MLARYDSVRRSVWMNSRRQMSNSRLHSVRVAIGLKRCTVQISRSARSDFAYSLLQMQIIGRFTIFLLLLLLLLAAFDFFCFASFSWCSFASLTNFKITSTADLLSPLLLSAPSISSIIMSGGRVSPNIGRVV